MEIFPRGFVLGRNYGDLSRTFKINTKDESGKEYQAILKLEKGVLKLANNLKHADNLSFIVKRIYSKMTPYFAMYDMNYKIHFLKKNKKMCRPDLEYASFLASIGEVVGLYVDTCQVNSLLLFMSKKLKFSDTQLNNLESLKDMIFETDMLETMLCDGDYKNNKVLTKEETILLFEKILNSNEYNNEYDNEYNNELNK